jgi:hypothetical protein
MAHPLPRGHSVPLTEASGAGARLIRLGEVRQGRILSKAGTVGHQGSTVSLSAIKGGEDADDVIA